jgi:hypothetical protein
MRIGGNKMLVEIMAKEINKTLKEQLTVEEFKIYCNLSQNSINNISKKIEKSISIPPELHIVI